MLPCCDGWQRLPPFVRINTGVVIFRVGEMKSGMAGEHELHGEGENVFLENWFRSVSG